MILRHAFYFSLLVQAFAQNGTEQVPTFDDVVNILGDMQRTDVDFQDGLALDLFSPKNRTVVVQANKNPLSGQFVTGSTGEGFVALAPYSYVIKLNEPAQDLIAKIEIPYTLETLAAAGVQESNTYVGTLAPDRASWIVSERQRNVHRSENVTRIIKMTSLDGEYILLGRRSVDTTNIFVQYGQGETRTVNVTAGGRQEAEFVDGLRFSMMVSQSLRMNVDFQTGISRQVLPPGTVALNPYAWVVNTTGAQAGIQASMLVPVNAGQLLGQDKRGTAQSTLQLAIGRRNFNAAPNEMFQLLPNTTQPPVLVSDSRILVPNMKQLDGQYVLLAVGSTVAETSREPTTWGTTAQSPAGPSPLLIQSRAHGREDIMRGLHCGIAMIVLAMHSILAL